MKINFKSLALCAAMLSFGFANNNVSTEINTDSIKESLKAGNFANVYEVHYGPLGSTWGWASTVYDIMMFDTKNISISEISDLTQTPKEKLQDCYDFECKYKSLSGLDLIIKGSANYDSWSKKKPVVTIDYKVYIKYEDKDEPEALIKIIYSPSTSNSGGIYICPPQQDSTNFYIRYYSYKNFFIEMKTNVEELTALAQQIITKLHTQYDLPINYPNKTLSGALIFMDK